MEEPIVFYPTIDFPYTKLVEENLNEINRELQTIINLEATARPLSSQWLAAHPNYVKGSEHVSWKTFEFLFFGIEKRQNIERCPKTYEVLQKIPELITAQFSVLQPNTHILPHKGYSKIILRNHLPLIVPPDNQCAIKIEDKIHYWKTGELVIFDDSLIHQAWNNSNEIRAVLMFDVAKPGCGYSAKEICKYKIEHIDDPFLLQIADKSEWIKWHNQGYFDVEDIR